MKKHLENSEENKEENGAPDDQGHSTKGGEGLSIGELLGQLFERIASPFKKGTSSLIGAATVAVFGAIAFWMTPIKTKVYHWIWKEKVEIRAGSSPLSVMAGKAFDIQPTIIRKGNIDIVEGDFRVSYDDRHFKHVAGSTMAHTPEIKSSHPLKDDLGLRLSPRKIGRFPVAFEFSTSYGFYQDTLWVESEDSFGVVTSTNWSGDWTGSLGGNSIEIEWVESKSAKGRFSLSGHYDIFDTGESGRVSGQRDGSKFSGDFFKSPNDLVKWTIVNADFKQLENGSNKYMEIIGKAQQKIKKGSNGWVDTELPEQDFLLEAAIEF